MDKLHEKLKGYFPCTPYQIQVDFSSTLYETISNKKFAIFSSPTGTGKSLSLICGAFAWYRDHSESYDFVKMCKTRREAVEQKKPSTEIATSNKGDITTQASIWGDEGDDASNSSLPDWLNNITDFNKSIFEQRVLISKNQIKAKATKFNDYLSSRKEKLKIRYEEQQQQQRLYHQQKSQKNESDEQKEERIFADLCINYVEESEPGGTTAGRSSVSGELQSEIENYKRQKLQQSDLKQPASNTKGNPIEKNERENQETQSEYPRVKIIYASRTHSQIKQFVQEILKTEFRSMRVITLGSRANLCTNPCVDTTKMSSASVDDYCSKAIGSNKTDSSVPICANYTNFRALEADVEFLFHSSVHTIDEMKTAAQNHRVCPYFLAKTSVQDADVICLPYVSLLDAQMREANGIELKNSIVLFDESHNILESLRDTHSASLSFKEIFHGFTQLQTYYDKYCRMLSPKNALHIQTIKTLCLDLMRFIKAQVTPAVAADNLSGTNLRNTVNNNNNGSGEYRKIDGMSLLLFLNMDRIDFFSLKKFTSASRITQKIHFFSQSKKYVPSNPPSLQKLFKDSTLDMNELGKTSSSNSNNVSMGMVVEKVIQFLWRLQASTTMSAALRFSLILKNCSTIEHHSNQPKLQWDTTIEILCLDVMQPLREIINESACVILAGGTMEPISEFHPLINAIGDENCTLFSCQHVIEEDQCAALCVSSFCDTPMVFSHANKKDDKLVCRSIEMLARLAKQVPEGLVVFVQSYSFLERLRHVLAKDKSMVDSIQKYKRIFFDEKEAANASLILENYQKEIERTKIARDNASSQAVRDDSTKNGAMLLSVVGGRLSEGINFSDSLARCVVVLGMPFSNIKSADLIEKMAYYDRLSKSIQRSGENSFCGNDYYETTCMKAVNQAVGRSIRHRNDYAMILLVDERFSAPKNLARLSSWIRQRTKVSPTFDHAEQEINRFFEKIQFAKKNL